MTGCVYHWDGNKVTVTPTYWLGKKRKKTGDYLIDTRGSSPFFHVIGGASGDAYVTVNKEDVPKKFLATLLIMGLPL